MGWYHCVQMLDMERRLCPTAVLRHVVEPWYLSGAGHGSPGSAEFHAWREEVERKYGVAFHASVADVPPPREGEVRMGLVSGRTADNPVFFRGCLGIGCTTIMLEKPGATTVGELEEMRDLAGKAGASVWMGFNKNVSAYISRSRELAAKIAGASIELWHSNTFANTEEALGECFERNAEGMLKNMVIHELAVLVTFYGVSVETLDEVVADTDFSSCRTLIGPSGRQWTDFDKLKFTVKTIDGARVTVAAERCGRLPRSMSIVGGPDGTEAGRFFMPDEATSDNIPVLEAKVGPAVSYFFTQDPDYGTLKERIAQSCLTGEAPDGVPSIDIGVETLRLAEHLMPALRSQLNS